MTRTPRECILGAEALADGTSALTLAIPFMAHPLTFFYPIADPISIALPCPLPTDLI